MNHPPRWLTWASFRPLFRGIGQRLLLIGPILLIVLIAGGWLGEYFGVPELFWNQNAFQQALAGFAVALLFAQICLVAFLLDAPKPWLRDLPGEAPEGWRRSLSALPYGVARLLVPLPPGDPEQTRQWLQLRWYLAVSWLPLLALLVILVALDAAARWGFLPGLAAAFLAVGTFIWLFQRMHAARFQGLVQRLLAKLPAPWVVSVLLIAGLAVLLTLAWLVPALRQVVVLLLGLWLGVTAGYAGESRYQDVPPEQRWVHGLAGASFGPLFMIYLVFLVVCLAAPGLSASLMPPAVALCVLLALIVAGHGFLKFHFGGWYTAIAGLLIAVAVGIGGLSGYRHQLREMDYGADQLVDLNAVDFQMESEAADTPLQRTRLEDSYGRSYQRYENQVRLFGADQDKVERKTKFGAVAEIQGEQKKLRAAMQGLEKKRLDVWKSNLSAGHKKPKLALVSVTGGANRSAVWSAFALCQLERELAASDIPFTQHLRVITGASGGMVGAAYFAATVQGPEGHRFASAAAAKEFARKVGQDALTPVSQRFLFFDLPGAFVPGGSTYDRGLALEQAWDSHLDGALEKSFESLAAGEAKAWRPSLIVAPMIVEDGRRLLISNLYLSALAETTGSVLALAPAAPAADGPEPTGRPRGRFQEERSRYSLTALEFFHLFPGSWSKFKLATAVRLNASFPYVSPAAALPTNPPRHAVDASYFDNYGVNLAAWWIYHHSDWIQENTSGVVVIQIRDAVSERGRLTPMTTPAEQKSWSLQHGLLGLTGPARGAREGLQAMMSFRNDEQLQVLSDRFNGAAAKAVPFFTTVVFEFPGAVAMSWYLSEREIEQAMTGFEPGSANDRALAGLRAWFKDGE